MSDLFGNHNVGFLVSNPALVKNTITILVGTEAEKS